MLGEEFAFETADTRWTYRFEAAPEGGTELSESFEMMKDEPVRLVMASPYLLRIKDRKADLEAGMRHTLERIKAVAEETA